MTDTNAISAANLAELKTALETAIADRGAVDARIKEIRAAIGVRLQEAQELSDAVNDVVSSITSKTVIDTAAGGIEIDLKSVWSFVLKYIIPALIMLAVLWFGVAMIKKANATPDEVSQRLVDGGQVELCVSE